MTTRPAAALMLTWSFILPPSAVAAETVSAPEAVETRNVPAISRSLADELLPYQTHRAASFQGWAPEGRRILITTRFGETPQLHVVERPGGARTQLTFLPERVLRGSFRPDGSRQILFRTDAGGAEDYQLFLLDPASGSTRRVSDGVHRHQGELWSRDGALLAYTHNGRTGRDFDVYLRDPDDPGEERLLLETEGTWSPVDFRPDGGALLVAHFVSVHESHLHVVDLDSGERFRLTPHLPGEPVAYRGGRWSPDGRFVYAVSDRDSEFLRLVRLEVASGRHEALTGHIDWDVESFDLSDDGRWLAFLTNEDGISRLHLLDTENGEEMPAPPLPPAVAGSLAFRPGSHEVAFTLNWARSPSDVYSHRVGSGELERWTRSETGGLVADRLSVPELVRFSTFDRLDSGERRTLSAFVYRPDAARHAPPYPVYVSIHGGPESQFRPRFQGTRNYLLEELGVAVVAPNVRGSAGYGKTFLRLDNGVRREDAVRDIGALLDWIDAQPDLDSSRVMVAGGSYGGYMSLATMVHYSDRLRCGYNAVGISNFVTFLENTRAYRRDLRRVEYGDERDPEMREFLANISPQANAHRIRRPLLVVQGANDPRVPLTESDQIVEAVEANDAEVWYLIAHDEGHGFSRRANQEYRDYVLYEFLRRCLLEEPS